MMAITQSGTTTFQPVRYYNEKNLIIFMGAGSISNEAQKLIINNCEK